MKRKLNYGFIIGALILGYACVQGDGVRKDEGQLDEKVFHNKEDAQYFLNKEKAKNDTGAMAADTTATKESTEKKEEPKKEEKKGE